MARGKGITEQEFADWVQQQHAKGNTVKIDGVECKPGEPVPPPRSRFGPTATPAAAPAATAAKGKKTRKRDLPMVATLFAEPGTWVLPIVTASETNDRKWRERSRRSDDAWRVVSPAFGPRVDYYAHFQRHYHSGGTLIVTFTRLGGKKLDRANLGSALKATEDAVAYMLGANDGDDRWKSVFEQEPHHERMGVRIEIRCDGTTPWKAPTPVTGPGITS